MNPKPRCSSKSLIPISLIVDDGAPVNLLHFGDPSIQCDLLLPHSILDRFAGMCAEYGVKGKYSVLPMPNGLGRLDRKLNYVPAGYLKKYLETVRRKIAPRFDITPEILTHQQAWNPRSNGISHYLEDEWVRRADVKAMISYFSLAFEILKHAGLPATGMTSPWMTGNRNEGDYAEAIGRAQWKVYRRKFSWYFLHCLGNAVPRAPWVAWQNRKSGLRVVTVPANTSDVFYGSWGFPDKRAERRGMAVKMDSWLTADGKSGRIRRLVDQRMPVTLLTHWQSLHSNGKETGLIYLEKILSRIQNNFGERLQWMTCRELAATALK